MSAAGKRGPGPLAEAALGLEAELEQVESVLREAARAPLTSRRALEQAAARLGELADVERRVGPRLEALSRAMASVVDRQRATAEAVAARAAELAERRRALAELVAYHEQLGREAAELNAFARAATERFGRDDGRVAVLDFADMAERLLRLAAGARILGTEARASGFDDVERDARAMEQQLLAARNRLKLVAERSAGAPS